MEGHGRRLQMLSHHLTMLHTSSSNSSNWKGFSGDERRRGLPVVVGAMVLDIQGVPASLDLRPGTTTPGEIRYVKGGVGRNVAECMAKLGAPPFLISFVGDDMAGDLLLAQWQSLGLRLEGIRRCTETSTPVVSAIFDHAGELAAAVADTSSIEDKLTPDWIEQFADIIIRAPVIMLDGNLHPCALEAVCKLAAKGSVPVLFEPVSVAKSVRATNLLNSITYISPNEGELLAMANALPAREGMQKFATQGHMGKEDAISAVFTLEILGAVEKILQEGVKYIILTLGKHGAVLCSVGSSRKIIHIYFPALPVSVVRLSGAGDCLVAGTLAALSANLDIMQAVAYGIGAAKLAVESESNVPVELPLSVVTGMSISGSG